MKERKPNRLKKFNYSQGGGYFVTICTKHRASHFGEINNAEMILNDYGEIADDMFKGIENIHENIVLDKYVVMPNHIHGIIIITDPIVGDAYSKPQNKYLQGKYSDKITINSISPNMRPLPNNNYDYDRSKMLLSKVILYK